MRWRVPADARAATWNIRVRCGSTAAAARRAKPFRATIKVRGKAVGQAPLDRARDAARQRQQAPSGPRPAAAERRPAVSPDGEGGPGAPAQLRSEVASSAACGGPDNGYRSVIDGTTLLHRLLHLVRLQPPARLEHEVPRAREGLVRERAQEGHPGRRHARRRSDRLVGWPRRLRLRARRLRRARRCQQRRHRRDERARLERDQQAHDSLDSAAAPQGYIYRAAAGAAEAAVGVRKAASRPPPPPPPPPAPLPPPPPPAWCCRR